MWILLDNGNSLNVANLLGFDLSPYGDKMALYARDREKRNELVTKGTREQVDYVHKALLGEAEKPGIVVVREIFERKYGRE